MPQRVEDEAQAATVAQAIKTSPTVALTAAGTLPTLYLWGQELPGSSAISSKTPGRRSSPRSKALPRSPPS